MTPYEVKVIDLMRDLSQKELAEQLLTYKEIARMYKKTTICCDRKTNL